MHVTRPWEEGGRLVKDFLRGWWGVRSHLTSLYLFLERKPPKHNNNNNNNKNQSGISQLAFWS
jgi:hypothetical protein